MNNNMMSIGPSGYKTVSTRRVFFTGDVAIAQGEPLCYDYTTNITAATGKPSKDGHPALGNCVKVATAGKEFAGVSVQAYAAKEGGQWVDIYLPGSICPVLAGASAAVETSMVASSGKKFVAQGSTAVHGAGSVIILQTAANGKLALAKLEEGASITLA